MIWKKLDIAALYNQNTPKLGKYDTDLLQLLAQLMTNLNNMFNRGLTFTDNFQGQTISFTSDATPDTEFAVAHTLKTTPSGFIVIGTDKAASIYKGTTAWTNAAIYLKANAGSVGTTVQVF